MWPGRLRAVLASRSLSIAGVAVLIATLRIVATYPVFNHTIDVQLEPQHPPLARVFAAPGPFLAGERSQGRKEIYSEGAAILYHDGKYE